MALRYPCQNRRVIAEVIAIGTELLLGRTVDTHSAELGRILAAAGVDHLRRQTVGDNEDRLVEALRLALSRADVVLTIGGLGPTEDDVTRSAVARATDTELIEDPDLTAGLRSRARGERPESYFRQAWIPRGARVVPNEAGTAAGLIVQRGSQWVVCLPGPSAEFVPMARGPVRTFLEALGEAPLRMHTLRVVGVPESVVEERLRDLVHQTDPTVATFAKLGEVHVAVTSRGDATATVAAVRVRLGERIYGEDDQTLEAVVIGLLEARGERLATAESCSGGLLAGRLTSVPGSSKAFAGGVVAYTVEVKRSALGVRSETLAEFGAVAGATAGEMATGALAAFGVEWAAAITGEAGPHPSEPPKPVGLVFVAVATNARTETHEFHFRGERDHIRALAAQAALAMLRDRLIEA